MRGSFLKWTVENAALAWLEAIGWRIVHGPDIAPEMPGSERRNYGEVTVPQRLYDALFPILISARFGLWMRSV